MYKISPEEISDLHKRGVYFRKGYTNRNNTVNVEEIARLKDGEILKDCTLDRKIKERGKIQSSVLFNQPTAEKFLEILTLKPVKLTDGVKQRKEKSKETIKPSPNSRRSYRNKDEVLRFLHRGKTSFLENFH